jgi:hypothetical protein
VLLIRSGRAHWVKTKNPAAPAVKRESEIGAKTDDGEAKNTEPMHPLSRYRLGLRGAYPSSMGWRECMRLRRAAKSCPSCKATREIEGHEVAGTNAPRAGSVVGPRDRG